MRLRTAASRLLIVSGLVLAAVVPSFAAAPAERVIGTWVGILDAGPARLQMIFKVEAGDDGALRSSITVPAQGLEDLPFDVTTFENGKLRLELKLVDGYFEGTLTDDGTLDGEWGQMGATYPLEMERAGEVTPPARPQTPQPPFPYRSEEIGYANEAAGILFQGTLTIPEGPGPHPAVVLISGSGPQDRDETLFGHKPFWVWADHLSRNGFAVLRVDDRGVAGTAGSTAGSTMEDHAGDALAAVAFLKEQREIDGARIGLIGHSEGAVVAPMAAVQSDDVAFIVCLAPTGVTGLEVMQQQARIMLTTMGADGETINRLADIRRRLCETVVNEPDDEVAMEAARPILDEALEGNPALANADQAARDALAEGELKKLCNAWMRFFIAFDPTTVFGEVTIPTLALWGEKDWQVLPDENSQPVLAALAAAGNEAAVGEIVPGVNHLFQTAENGDMSLYQQIEQTVEPAVLDRVTEWLRQTCGM